MVKENLVEYIKTKLDEKYSRDGIKLALRRLGYSVEEINAAFDVVMSRPKPLPSPKQPAYKSAEPQPPVKLVKLHKHKKLFHSEEEHDYARKFVSDDFLASVAKNKKVVALVGVALILIFVALFALDQMGDELFASNAIEVEEPICSDFSKFEYQSHSLNGEGEFKITLKSLFSSDITITSLAIDNLKFSAFQATDVQPNQVVTLRGDSSIMGVNGAKYTKSVKVGYTVGSGDSFEEGICRGTYQ